MRLLLVFLAAITMQAQVTITVNWPNKSIVRAKYGRLPATIYPGAVTACNQGTGTVLFGQGLAIQALKAQSLEAYSRTDAIAVITAAQRGAFRSRWLQWSPVGLAALNVFTGGLATGVLSASTAVRELVVGITVLANQELPVLNGGFGPSPWLTYEADGLGGLYQLTAAGSANSCVTGTVMFATPGIRPAGGSSVPSFSVNVPVGQ